MQRDDDKLTVANHPHLIDQDHAIHELHRHDIAVGLNEDFVREFGDEDGSYLDYGMYTTVEWLQVYYDSERTYGRDTAAKDGFFSFGAPEGDTQEIAIQKMCAAAGISPRTFESAGDAAKFLNADLRNRGQNKAFFEVVTHAKEWRVWMLLPVQVQQKLAAARALEFATEG